jgi:hypothetical protein
MGDINQLWFVKENAENFEGPYLEVGSKDYGSTQDLRSIFLSQGKYIGIDMREGKGVDLVLDLTHDFEEIDRKLKGERFGTIFCLSVMEHCAQPFIMAKNITRLLRDQGKLCISAPFSWKFHGYPSDYWRFTPEGIKILFPRLSFDLNRGLLATQRYKEFYPLDENIGKISFSSQAHWSKGHIIRGITAKSLHALAKVGLLRWLVGYRYVMPPTIILMIGVLQKDVPYPR